MKCLRSAYTFLPLILAVALVLLWTAPLFAETAAGDAKAQYEQKFEPNPADQSWMFISSGLVLLMVPGLALFYGGMARRKNILGTMMHSMVAISIVGLFWVVCGYAMAFGTSQDIPGLGKGWIGWNPGFVGLYSVNPNQNFSNTTLSIYTHCVYQGMFAIITPALISGAVAERIKFGPYCLFILLWCALVYVPLAHWVWAVEPGVADPATGVIDYTKDAPAGWLGKMGALDFAGGTVVHVAAGFSGLAAILMLRKRIGYPQHAMHPSSMVLTLFGAGVLWVGWFGFNGGSALASNGLAGSAIMATQVGAASAGLTWMLIEWIHRKKPTALGFATGAVAGLVAITPASGFVTPMGALAVGAIGAAVCYGFVMAKPFLKYDDSLDAFGVHGVGGFVGALLTGVFASELINPASKDASVLTQGVAACAAAAYAFVVTLVLVKGIDLTLGFCVTPETEQEGLDRAIHGEVGIDMGPEAEVAMASGAEPRAAVLPPGGVKHFTVVVEAGRNGELATAWTRVCQPSASPSPDFLKLYPFLTTVQGNRFHFRGGDPKELSASLQRLLGTAIPGTPVKTSVEN